MNTEHLKIYVYCSLACMLFVAVVDRRNPRRVREIGGLLVLFAASHAVPRWVIDSFIPPMETEYVIYVSKTRYILYAAIWFLVSLQMAIVLIISVFLYFAKSLSFTQMAVCHFLLLNLLTATEIMLEFYFPAGWTAPYPFGKLATTAAIATIVLSITLLYKHLLSAAKAYDSRKRNNQLGDAMAKS
ncbi:hypothetical protein [Cardiobacterium hominis]|uniref:hypothetical protein n=1 Tax=Cardiobacterium hominis TaxID=2718 RepID=UPI0028E53C5C|nr:hypothetical protein [Cardiobacterium hominis]